ncbi:bifunctional RNase H/acid phosphatase [Nocardioides sp. T2.26MG-1]|uniref:bifunctional RNase H/acid phosphatase n=1 Tax=Nocardioides sp. T2.26MG-1 TaxID=3041166 RepID=UPI0024777AA7|nr:bifunctional RNase H/acid phosphatase [Nocardioides sp. T2.26MG-1]CAI9404414.1 Bifunctional protein [Nocardioides sp. T2.26MG-1]
MTEPVTRPSITRVVIEADGGSRGNPGPAAYGAVLRDADTGAVIAEDGTAIGVASNNVAEYSALIAGLRLAEQYAPDAEIEVRMDSKLVVEQMSGRWKIKHPDMRPLAAEATRLAPSGTTYTWVPRGQNTHADRLVNEALDGKRSGVTVAAELQEPDSLIEEVESPRAPEGEQPASIQSQARGWGGGGEPTTVVLVRHGVTPHTTAKRFSGGLASANPGLSDEGKAQIRAVADWLSPIADRVDAVVASPVRRTRESAEILADVLGREVEVEPGFAEMEFGAWDGLTFAEVGERYPEDLKAWLGSLDVAPGGGESFRVVQERVLAGLARLLEAHTGKTVVVVSHVTPIKTLVANAVDASLEAVFRMELTPASVTVISYYDDRPSLRMYNALPPGNDVFAADVTKW